MEKRSASRSLGSRVGMRLNVLVNVLLVCLAATRGRAQEAPPVPLSLAVAADGQLMAMQLRDAGLALRGTDGRFHLLCGHALGIASGSRLRVGARPGGGFWIAHQGGLARTQSAGCGFESRDPDVGEALVVDVDGRADSVRMLVYRDGQYAVMASEDGGESFEQAFELPAEDGYFTIRRAPSDPQRYYLTAASNDDGEVTRLIYRTDDGGKTFSAQPFDGDEAVRFDLVGVDPGEPERVFVMLWSGASVVRERVEGSPKDVLMVSEDGGETFAPRARLHMFGGLAFGAEGELWLGDALGGLFHSRDGGETLTELDPGLHVTCLERRAGRLWVCADATRNAFSVGYSDDDGGTITPAALLSDVVGVLECDGESVGCGAPWRGLRYYVERDVSSRVERSGPDAGQVAGDGSVRADAGSAGGGDGLSCACHLAGRPGFRHLRQATPVLLALALLGLSGGRRRS